MHVAYLNVVWFLFVGAMSLLILRERRIHSYNYFGIYALAVAVAGFFIPTEFLTQFVIFYFP